MRNWKTMAAWILAIAAILALGAFAIVDKALSVGEAVAGV